MSSTYLPAKDQTLFRLSGRELSALAAGDDERAEKARAEIERRKQNRKTRKQRGWGASAADRSQGRARRP